MQLSGVTMADYNTKQTISSNKGPKHINSFSSLNAYTCCHVIELKFTILLLCEDIFIYTTLLAILLPNN